MSNPRPAPTPRPRRWTKPPPLRGGQKKDRKSGLPNAVRNDTEHFISTQPGTSVADALAPWAALYGKREGGAE